MLKESVDYNNRIKHKTHNKIRYSPGIFQSVSTDLSQLTEGW